VGAGTRLDMKIVLQPAESFRETSQLQQTSEAHP
jgi:hypothetical protein